MLRRVPRSSIREHRSTAQKARKFIPDGDSDFANMARVFAQRVALDPAKHGLSQDEVEEVAAAVAAFRDAMAANYDRQTRCIASVAAKDEARRKAEGLIRRATHIIRAKGTLSAADKVGIRLTDRPERLRRRDCPQTPPHLWFVASAAGLTSSHGRRTAEGFGTVACGRHTIAFRDPTSTTSRAKPAGAARLELFVDLVPPGEPIPLRPGDRNNGRAWYLRSYSRSPVRVEYPRSEAPMRVVYWGRWASPTGETGPFSAPLAAPIEGADWAQFVLPAPAEKTSVSVIEPRRLEQTVTITSARRDLPDCVETVDTIRAASTRMLVVETSEIAEAA